MQIQSTADAPIGRRPLDSRAADLRHALSGTGSQVIATTLLALALRVVFVGSKSIWSDEGISILVARLDWPSFVSVLAQYEANMSLYYVLLRYWLLLGDSEALIRSLSVVCAVITVPLLYMLGKRLFGKPVGITAAFLLAVNAFHIEHAQSARSYSLLVLLVTLSSLYFAAGVERPSRKVWTAYVLASALTVYSHVFAGLALVSQWTSVPSHPLRRRIAGHLAAATSAIAILLLPLAFFVLTTDISGADWMRRPGLRAVVGLFAALSGGKFLVPVYFITCLIALRTVVRKWKPATPSRDTWPYVFVFTWFAVPIVLALGLSLFRPLFAWRYLIICLPPLLLIVAVGIQSIRLSWIRVGTLVVVATLSIHATTAYYRSTGEEDWREATQYILSSAKPGDGIFIYAGVVRAPFDYYRRRLSTRAWQPPIIFPPGAYGRPTKVAEQQLVSSSLESIAHYDRVWLVLSHDEMPSLGRDVVSLAIRARLATLYPLVVERTFTRVAVLLYVPAHRAR